MSRHVQATARAVLAQSSAAAPSTSTVRKPCVYAGCTYVATGPDQKAVTHTMGSHVSNVHGATTTIWYGAKQIKIEREIKTQEMRCPCGYSHVNSARVRMHATKEHKNSGLKTALLASRQSAQPSASSSRTRSVSPSSIESSSPTRSVSPIQNSDTPPTSHTSGRKPKASKPLPRREQIVASAKPQRTSLGMAEQRLLKPVAPRTTAMHQLSVSVPKLLTEKTQADKQSRGHASHKQAVSSHRSSILPSTSVSGASSSTSRKVSKTPATSSTAVAKGKNSSANRIKSIGKSAIVHRTTQLDAPSTGSKRPRSPQPTGTSAQPKARKVSHASEAASSSRRPAIVLPTDSSDNDSVATAELLAAFAPRLSQSTHCKTCHRALELRDGRYKNCVECREKSRAYQRKYHQERQERTARVSSLLSRFETPPGVTASSASAAPARAQASSSEAGPEPVSTDDTMDVDVGVNVKVQTQKPRRAQAKASVPNVNIRRVWENVPEFQTEEAFFEAVEQSVVEWREREPGERFEFCGGYAVVAGRKDADAAIVRKICGKLVLRSAPISRLSCFTRLTAGGDAPEGKAYHVLSSLSTVYTCECQDTQDEDGNSNGKGNVCRGRFKIIVETTNEMNALGAFGMNVVVETSHAW